MPTHSHIPRLPSAARGVALLLFLFLAFATFADKPAAPPMSAPPVAPIHTLYDRALPAIVEILVNDQLNGSGWIADREGYVITAAHVVSSDKPRIEILTKDQGRLDAKLIAVNLGHDLALLKLPQREGGYPFLTHAKKTPTAGSDIYLFGAPIYRHAVMLKGNVARNTTTFEYLPTQRSHIEAIHVAAHTPRGTSGGPWLTDTGEVVALQSGMMSDQNAQVGIAFVIPIQPIQFLLNTKASATTPTLGVAVEELWEQPRDFLKKYPAKLEGIVLRQPIADGPAAKAGLKESDVVLALSGHPVRLRDQFMRFIRDAKVGDEVKLRFLRDGNTTPQEVSVKIGRMEKD